MAIKSTTHTSGTTSNPAQVFTEVTQSPILNINTPTMFTHLENPYGPPNPEELARISQNQTAPTSSNPFTLPSMVEQSEQIAASLSNQEYFTVPPPQTETTSARSAQQLSSSSQVEGEQHYRLCGAKESSSSGGPLMLNTNSLIPRIYIQPSAPISSQQPPFTESNEKQVHNDMPKVHIDSSPNINSPAGVSSEPVELNIEQAAIHPSHSTQVNHTNTHLPSPIPSPDNPSISPISHTNPQLHRLQTWRTKYLHHLISDFRNNHKSWSQEKQSKSAKKIMMWKHASLKALEGLMGWVKENKAKERGKNERQARRKPRVGVWTEEEVGDVEVEMVRGGVCSSCVGGKHLLKCGHLVLGDGECRGNCWGSKEVGMGIPIEGFECGECVRVLDGEKRLSAVEEVVGRNDYLDCLPWEEDED